MDNKEESKTNNLEENEKEKSDALKGELAATNSTNAKEDKDASPLLTSKVSKKKNKANKGRNSAAANDLDTELKKLTQRRINVAGAPKMPLNSYVRFMNDRREQLRREQPQRTALEHTKMIGEEWHQLTEDRRAPYMEAAAKDKALYQEQMQKFLREHPDILATELAKAKKVLNNKNASTPKEKASNNISSNNDASSSTITQKKNSYNSKLTANKQSIEPLPDPDDIPLAQVKRTPTPPAAASFSACAIPRPFGAGEIPIYTNEFIEHNRSTENELRMLRKAKTDLEQQNAVLEQHVDNTKTGHAKVMGEVAELKEENARLMAYITGLRQKLVSSLDSLQLPAVDPSGLNVDTVDKYIQHLAGMISSSSVGGQPNHVMLLKVGDIVSKIDTSGLHKP